MADILLIDDDGEEREIFTGAIHAIDPTLKCLCFSSAEIAFDYLEDMSHQTPLCIFVDIYQPTITGFEIVRRIREIQWIEKVPVVVLSGTQREQETQRYLNLKANLVVVKPWSQDDYLKIIKSAIKHVI